MIRETGQRILVVEDSLLLALELERLLQERGLVVELANNVEGAKKIIEARNLDAALLDIDLGGTTSFPIGEKLIEHSIPFAFLTAYARIHAVPSRFLDFPLMEKPVQEHELFAVVTRLIRESSLGLPPMRSVAGLAY